MLKPIKKPIQRLLYALPLRTVLIVPFVLQIVGAVSLVSYLSYRNGQQAINDLATQLIEESRDRVNQQLDRYLQLPHQMNQVNLAAINSGLFDPQQPEAAGLYFWHQIQAFDVSYIAFGGTEGRFIGAGYYDGELLIDQVAPAADDEALLMHSYLMDEQGQHLVSASDPQAYDHRSEPAYTDAVMAETALWSQIYQWEEWPEVLSISASQPVYDEDQSLVGVLTVDLVLNRLSDFLADTKTNQAGAVFIVERNGLLVASCKSEAPYRMEAGEAMRLHAVNSRDPLIQATAQHLMTAGWMTEGLMAKEVKSEGLGSESQISESLRSERSESLMTESLRPESLMTESLVSEGTTAALADDTVLEVDLKGERHFLSVVPWQDKYGLDWLVVFAVPESAFMAQIQAHTRVTVLLCLAATWVAILSGLITSRWIVQPILQLNDSAKQLAQGQWHNTLDLRRSDVLGQLTHSFHQMAQQLHSTVTSLEQRVEERTAELAQAKDAAEVASQTKSAFLANMSHELRTPLNSILGFTQILEQDAQLTAEQQANIGIIASNGHYLLSLINQVLDLSKIEAGRMVLHAADFDLYALLQDVQELFHIKAAEKGLQLQIECAVTVPQFIHADELKLRQVLINLLSNAVKFTSDGCVILRVQLGTVDADLQVSKTEAKRQQTPSPTPASFTLQFEVEDTGPGIATAEISQLFEAFVQTQAGLRSQEGTGLGLSISQQLVELMGGTIDVISKSGRGSIFRFQVPVQPSRSQFAAQSVTVSASAGWNGNDSVPWLHRSSSTPVPRSRPDLQADLNQLPPDWVAALRDAAHCLDDEAILQLLNRPPHMPADVLALLKGWVDHLRFDLILQLVQQSHHVQRRN